MSLDPLAFLGAAPPPSFPSTSRYHDAVILLHTLPDGRVVRYLRRRLLPNPDHMTTLQEHSVADGDRLDQISAHYLGDPALFWKVCDANLAFKPDELVSEAGKVLKLALPEGTPPTPPHA